MVERTLERQRYAKIHEILYNQGFTNQVSFYGTLKVPYDGKHVQARIEVISKERLTPGVIMWLYNIFNTKPINREYTLYLFVDKELTEVKI